VGYQDKYMGALEMSLEDYQLSEVKDHSVLCIKRLGQVLWHREDKLDLI
jgi:hypothetical protein